VPQRRGDNGPHAATLEAHTRHRAGSAGSECVACHMPKIEQTTGDVNVRSHTLRFTSCTTAPCHADKPASWTGTP
jgi:formate-dependent nitrite reductase cytochrome c552 subunit